MNSGIELVEKAVNYLMTDIFVIQDGGLTYDLFNFKTLTPSVRTEFNKWLNGVDENEDTLFEPFERLTEINNRENGTVKTRISFEEVHQELNKLRFLRGVGL